MTGYWLTTLFFFLVFLFFLYKTGLHKHISISFRWVALAFLVKVLCGIAYGYFDAYSGKGGDSMNYFWDANWIFKAFHQHPLVFWQMVTGIHDQSAFIDKEYYHYLITWKVNDFDYFFNDSRTLVRMHLLIRLFSMGNYTVHVIAFTFLSFVGQLLLLRTFRNILPGTNSLSFLLICFLPTSMIWLSGTMKETVVVFGLGVLLYHLQKCLQPGTHRKSVILALLAALLILCMRFYFLVCLLPGLLLLIWLTRYPGKPILKIAVVGVALFISAWSFDYFATDYKVSHIIHDQQMNFVKKEQYFHPGSKVEYTRVEPTMTDVLLQAPHAFLVTLTAPVHELRNNPYRLLFFLENCLLAILLVWVFFHFKLPVSNAFPWLIFCVITVEMLYILVGLTVPFEGAIVRFRSVVLPFVIFILAGFARTGKINSMKIIQSLHTV